MALFGGYRLFTSGIDRSAFELRLENFNERLAHEARRLGRSRRGAVRVRDVSLPPFGSPFPSPRSRAFPRFRHVHRGRDLRAVFVSLRRPSAAAAKFTAFMTSLCTLRVMCVSVYVNVRACRLFRAVLDVRSFVGSRSRVRRLLLPKGCLKRGQGTAANISLAEDAVFGTSLPGPVCSVAGALCWGAVRGRRLPAVAL